MKNIWGDGMRLFYAVTFTDAIKAAIVPYRDMIADNSLKGRFVAKENFHVTLEFIGEVSLAELGAYIKVLESIRVPEMRLHASYIGSFKKQAKEIIWMGFEVNPGLNELQRFLVEQLKNIGFEPAQHHFRPHITLGRQVILLGDLQQLVISPLYIKPHSIALMESKRVGGRLVYEPVAEILMV